METQKFIVKFDYNIELINTAIAEVEEMDFSDIAKVTEKHKQFVKIRTTIKDQEKTMVEEANAFRKNVFSKRDDYLKLSVPVEDKLKGILDDEKERLETEARKALLPEKKEKLSKLKIVQPEDDELLQLNAEDWVSFYEQKLTEHQSALDTEENKRQEEEQRKEREAQIAKDAEEKARADEKQKADAKIKALELEKEQARLSKILDERNLKEKEDDKKREARNLSRRKEFNEFLQKNNHDKKTDILKDENGEVKIYRLVATFIKEV